MGYVVLLSYFEFIAMLCYTIYSYEGDYMIKLSISEKGFALVRDGKSLIAKAFTGSNKRQLLLQNLQRGIVAGKDFIEHEDILIIEVNDSYVYNWLKEDSPNSKYLEQFTATHIALNKLICKYRFVLNNNPIVNRLELEKSYIPVSNFEM